MSDNREKRALVLSLIRKLIELDSWCGETHIQKSLYFLQALVKVPVGYNYILYKHGPYSFDLHRELMEMRANRYLDLVPRKPYGPSIRPGHFAKMLERNSEVAARYAKHVEFVAEHLASKTVRDLEALSTALYVMRERSSSDAEAVKMIMRLKPHITADMAETSLRSIKEMERGASRLLSA